MGWGTMNYETLYQFRNWVPLPDTDGKIRLQRWILLEGNRMAVAGALLTFVYVSLILIGFVWSFEMLKLLTETSTVENILETFLSGIILIVSIVVSINSIVLSQDMTSVHKQQNRISGVNEFWQSVNQLSSTDERPSDLQSFLEAIGSVLNTNAQTITDVTEGFDTDDRSEAREYAESVTDAVDDLGGAASAGGDFALLWSALGVDYGPLLDRTHLLQSSSKDSDPPSYSTSLENLSEAFQQFAVGREYFKTLYYGREVSRLSRVLLVVSLPAILITASAILSISAGVFPKVWVFGLPPLHSFVATTFTIALVPYIVLTSFMLRLSTVAKRTNKKGLLSMR